MAATRALQAPPAARSPRSVLAACAIGTSLEWYDFFLYGTAATLVFGPLFFPQAEPATATLLAFATYGVGFVARPFGAVLFGHLGDRVGRRNVLAVTLLLMGMSTFLIGILPTHASIGVAAPIILVGLRFLQGLSLGGEWGGAVLLSIEHYDRGRWGLAGSWVQIGVPAGNLLAAGILAAANLLLSAEAFATWGWRPAFLVSAALSLVGLWIRRNVAESPLFTSDRAVPSNPILDVWRTHRRALLASFLTRFGTDVAFYVFTLYLITYLTDAVGVDAGTGLGAVLAGSAVQLVLIPWFGRLSDRFDRVRVLQVGTVSAMLWAWAFFPLLDTGSTAAIGAAVVVALIAHAAMYGPQAAFIAERFDTRVRYSGTSLGYQLAGVPGGALAPIIAIALYGWAGSSVIALYTTGALAVALLGLALGRRTGVAGRAGSARPADADRVVDQP